MNYSGFFFRFTLEAHTVDCLKQPWSCTFLNQHYCTSAYALMLSSNLFVQEKGNRTSAQMTVSGWSSLWELNWQNARNHWRSEIDSSDICGHARAHAHTHVSNPHWLWFRMAFSVQINPILPLIYSVDCFSCARLRCEVPQMVPRACLRLTVRSTGNGRVKKYVHYACLVYILDKHEYRKRWRAWRWLNGLIIYQRKDPRSFGW